MVVRTPLLYTPVEVRSIVKRSETKTLIDRHQQPLGQQYHKCGSNRISAADSRKAVHICNSYLGCSTYHSSVPFVVLPHACTICICALQRSLHSPVRVCASRKNRRCPFMIEHTYLVCCKRQTNKRTDTPRCHSSSSSNTVMAQQQEHKQQQPQQRRGWFFLKYTAASSSRTCTMYYVRQGYFNIPSIVQEQRLERGGSSSSSSCIYQV